MKKALIQILIALLLILLLPSSLLAAGRSLPSYYTESYYAELMPMIRRLKETEGRKLVVLGNSDVAFGLNGALLEQLLEEKGYSYTVCPFGLYAAVGTSAMLQLSEQFLGENDLVVVVAEPVSETLSTYFGPVAFWKCIEDNPSAFVYLNGRQRTELLCSYISYLQERYAIYKSNKPPVVQGVYAKASFDDRCDMIYQRDGNIMPIGYDTARPVDFSAVSLTEEFAEQISAYCKAAENTGAAVCISFSPVNRSAVTDLSENAIRQFFSLINTSLPCPVISNPNRYILDSGWFYDTNFHLNSAGAALRTVTLAEDILAFLGCYEELEYELPQMPPSSVITAENDQNDNDYFFYSSIGENAGWEINGINEEGLLQQQLSVPAFHLGKPVTGFTPDALEKAAVLEELTLPNTIESIPDCLFASCHRLTRLILQHTETVCKVTEHSFDHAEQLRIFVPAAAYPLYRDGYGCETNLWASYLDRIFTY